MSKKVVTISEGEWKSGALVPQSGVYQVFHAEHLLASEVTLLRAQSFPRCEACTIPVTFRLQRPLDEHASLSRFAVELYQLPVLGPTRRAG